MDNKSHFGSVAENKASFADRLVAEFRTSLGNYHLPAAAARNSPKRTERARGRSSSPRRRPPDEPEEDEDDDEEEEDDESDHDDDDDDDDPDDDDNSSPHLVPGRGSAVPDDDDDWKVAVKETRYRREAEKITIPAFPNLIQLPQWEIAVAQALVNASSRVDQREVQWFIVCKHPDSTLASLADSGKERFKGLDIKLATAVRAIVEHNKAILNSSRSSKGTLLRRGPRTSRF